MKQNLDSTKDEIQQYLEAEGFLTFYGYGRPLESSSELRWDTSKHPDFRGFLNVARGAGVKIVIFASYEFSLDIIDEWLDDLVEADMPREEKRSFERRLRELRAYEGFTHEIELSFDHDGKTYLFQLETDWYREFQDLINELDDTVPDEDEEEEGPLGGYFSNN